MLEEVLPYLNILVGSDKTPIEATTWKLHNKQAAEDDHVHRTLFGQGDKEEEQAIGKRQLRDGC